MLGTKIIKKCFIINVAAGLDVKIPKNINLKYDNYIQLSTELNKLYLDYSFEVLAIVLRATGLITYELVNHLQKMKVKNVK